MSSSSGFEFEPYYVLYEDTKPIPFNKIKVNHFHFEIDRYIISASGGLSDITTLDICNIILPKLREIFRHYSEKWFSDPENMIRENPFIKTSGGSPLGVGSADFIKTSEGSLFGVDSADFRNTEDSEYFRDDQIKFWSHLPQQNDGEYFYKDKLSEYKFILAHILPINERDREDFPDTICTDKHQIVLFIDTSYVYYCQPYHNMTFSFFQRYSNNIKIDKKTKFRFTDKEKAYSLDKISRGILDKKIYNFLNYTESKVWNTLNEAYGKSAEPPKYHGPPKSKFYIILNDTFEDRSRAKYYIQHILSRLQIETYLDTLLPRDLVNYVQPFFISYKVSFQKMTIEYDIEHEIYDLERDEETYEILAIRQPSIKEIVRLSNINRLIDEECDRQQRSEIFDMHSDTLDNFKWNVQKWVVVVELS